MRRIALLALVSLLPACGPDSGSDMAFGFGNAGVHTPLTDGYTMQRVMGEQDTVPPLVTESGDVWPSNLTARPTNAMERPLTDIPQTNDPYVQSAPSTPRMPTPAPLSPATTGRPVVVPGAVPGVTTGGTSGYQTYQVPGGGAGIIVPGNSGNTVIGPDGRVTTVPR